MDIVDMAHQIIDLAEDRDYWKRQANHYKEMYDDCMLHINQSVEMHNESFAGILVAALDPNSGINRMVRAVQRDPLKGAIEEN